jgi:hypothetical protein
VDEPAKVPKDGQKKNPPSPINGVILPVGRKKGSLNKVNAARQAVSDQLLDAWHAGDGPAKARKIVKAALDAAEEGDLSELNVILPYIARKQPERVELGPIESMTPDEIEAKWGKRQDR